MKNCTKKYEINYLNSLNRTDEIVDYETVVEIIDDLEMFERDDVNMIHELNPDGSLGETIWTVEEGLLVRTV